MRLQPIPAKSNFLAGALLPGLESLTLFEQIFSVLGSLTKE